MIPEVTPSDVQAALEIEPVHLKLHTDEQGFVDEVPLIDGRPAPYVRAIKLVVASPGSPAVAVLEVGASVDIEGHFHLIVFQPDLIEGKEVA